VTAAKQRVVLVSEASDTRTALAGYLRNAGFDVHECDELALPDSFGALVAISTQDTSDTLLADVKSWIKLTKNQRVVVVTSKPTLFKALVAAHGERLYVLPAPAFGWELVDALRASEPSRSRGV
jgi:hypothetical protein